MELKWLEDFISVAEKGHFSRAAAERFITQSALSRRVKSLEAWLGAELLDRSSHPITLTIAGETFMPSAMELVSKAYEARAAAAELVRLDDRSVTIASLHTLTMSYIPSLVSQLQDDVGRFSVSIVAETRTVEEYLIGLANGSSDFFVCYDHPTMLLGVDPNEFPKLNLNQHWIHPYQSVTLDNPRLDSIKGAAIPYLDYAPTTYMARVVEHCLRRAPFRSRLKTVYRASLAEGLLTAAKSGLGMAFLPETIAPGTAAEHGLVRLSESYSTLMSICIYKSSRNTNPIAERIWDVLAEQVGVTSDPLYSDQPAPRA